MLGPMLAESRIGANVPVSNLDEAIAFYESKLGLTLFERGDELRYARFSGAGQTKLGIYESATAGQARHTLASFVVDDVRAVVNALKARGVVFVRGVRHARHQDRRRSSHDRRHPHGLAQGPRRQHPRDRGRLTRCRPGSSAGVLVVARHLRLHGLRRREPLESAEDVVSDLTETVVERLDSVIHVNKVEGDAAFSRQIALMRMPRGAYSRAALLVRPMTPCLEAW
jgi:predicted enzyme related to lactoylglutathione lyase